MGSEPNGKPRSSPQNSIENQWLKRAQFKFYKETLLFGRLHDNFSKRAVEQGKTISSTRSHLYGYSYSRVSNKNTSMPIYLTEKNPSSIPLLDTPRSMLIVDEARLFITLLCLSNKFQIQIFLVSTSLKWLSDHKRSLACDFSLV